MPLSLQTKPPDADDGQGNRHLPLPGCGCGGARLMITFLVCSFGAAAISDIGIRIDGILLRFSGSSDDNMTTSENRDGLF